MARWKWIAIGGAMSSASPAAAEWHGTSWGMTRAEVRAAIGLATTEAPAPNPIHTSPDLVTTFSTEGFDFRVRLSFGRTGRLEDIEFRLTNGRPCTDVEHLLFGMFGEPSRVNVGAIQAASWRDPARGNRVDLINSGHEGGPALCTFGYTPLPTPERSGL